jgi:hypothetical protein
MSGPCRARTDDPRIKSPLLDKRYLIPNLELCVIWGGRTVQIFGWYEIGMSSELT